MTVGIIGYGRLGKIFARFCEPFFKEIIVCDSYKKIKKYRQEGLCKLLLHSDVIVLHVHLNDETYHMINDKTISSYMKQGCYLINTSRGDVVDERAVIRGLKNNIISGYATDVLSDELGSNINKSPIIKEMNKGANIIVTPHIGGMTIEAQEIAYLHSIEKLNKFLNN
jgi:D-3-phosphoglycerate dehydrogenase